jgi:hypothetical protein
MVIYSIVMEKVMHLSISYVRFHGTDIKSIDHNIILTVKIK